MDEKLIKDRIARLGTIALENLDDALDTIIVQDVFNEGFLSEITRQEVAALSELTEEVLREKGKE